MFRQDLLLRCQQLISWLLAREQQTIALAHVTLQRVREMVSAIKDPSFHYETAELKETIRQTINRTLNIITFGREGYAKILAEKQAREGGANDDYVHGCQHLRPGR